MAITQSEYDDKSYELRCYIADKIRDIQLNAQSLKNVEDEGKTKKTLVRISDFINEIYRGYNALEELSSNEIVSEEENNFNDINNIFG